MIFPRENNNKFIKWNVFVSGIALSARLDKLNKVK